MGGVSFFEMLLCLSASGGDAQLLLLHLLLLLKLLFGVLVDSWELSFVHSWFYLEGFAGSSQER